MMETSYASTACGLPLYLVGTFGKYIYRSGGKGTRVARSRFCFQLSRFVEVETLSSAPIVRIDYAVDSICNVPRKLIWVQHQTGAIPAIVDPPITNISKEDMESLKFFPISEDRYLKLQANIS